MLNTPYMPFPAHKEAFMYGYPRHTGSWWTIRWSMTVSSV